MTSLLYTAELDLAESDIKPFLDWYAYRHAPDLVPLGFRSSACYGTTGGDMNLFDIYEIPGNEIFANPDYRRMSVRDTYAPPILAKRRNKAHTIYRQHRLTIDGLGAGNLGAGNLGAGNLGAGDRLDADWITVSRFDSATDAETLAAALTGAAGELGRAGVSAVRFASRTTDHPTYTTTRPHLMLLLEWQRKPTAATALIETLTRTMDAKGPLSRQITFEGHRIYPWPND